MVIQSNMSPKAIVEVEGNRTCFIKYNVLIIEKTLESTIDTDILPKLLVELNSIVGSSTATCIEGGWQMSLKKE